jgi:hypothetical protein
VAVIRSLGWYIKRIKEGKKITKTIIENTVNCSIENVFTYPINIIAISIFTKIYCRFAYVYRRNIQSIARKGMRVESVATSNIYELT